MVVEVHLHTILERKTSQGYIRKLEVDLSPGTTLEELIELLDIQVNLDNIILVVNTRLAEPGQILTDRDVVHLIPALSGGIYG